MFGRRFRRGLRGSMSRRRSPTRRYNATRSSSQATTQKPIKAIRQQVNPIVDPKRPTKTVRTRRPPRAIPQVVNPIVDPIVDPKRPVMTARPMTQKPQYVGPMYSEGGSVRTPKSNFGTTDYRKTGMTTHTSVRSQKK